MIPIDFQSPSVYVQQIHNFIETGQGFSQIKKYLFKDLQDTKRRQQNLMIMKQICDRISSGLMRQSSQIADRAVHVLQELLEQSSDIVSEAMNQENFILSMITIAIFKRVASFHPQRWENIKLRICGIFLFWWHKYSSEQPHYRYLIYGYRELRNKNIQFPTETNIRQKKKKIKTQKEVQQQDNKIKAMSEVLQQIELLIQTTEIKVKNNPNQVMNKQSVRMLKYKNKYLYDLSMSKIKFSADVKQKIGNLYKRIRAVLKEIQIKNQKIVKAVQATDEQKYIKQKMDGLTPTKKKQYENSIFSLLEQKSSKDSEKTYNIEKLHVKVENSKKDQHILVRQTDLLDIGSPVKEKQLQKVQKNQYKQKIPSKDVIQIDLLNESQTIQQRKKIVTSPQKNVQSPVKLKASQQQQNQVGFCYQNYDMDIMSNSSGSPQKPFRNQKTPVKEKRGSSGSKRDFMEQIDDLMSPLSKKSIDNSPKNKTNRSYKNIQITPQLSKNQQFGEYINYSKQEDLI